MSDTPDDLTHDPTREFSAETLAFMRRVAEENIPFQKFLGIRLEEIRPRYARFRLPFREAFIGNPMLPAYHGGVITTLMDSVGGMAAITTLVSLEDRISTIDLRCDYLRFAGPADLIGEAHVRRSGNRIVVTDMHIHQGEAATPVAEGRGVFNVKRVPGGKPAPSDAAASPKDD
jgi:uncharacterized protein (TIGR00369 family)